MFFLKSKKKLLDKYLSFGMEKDQDMRDVENALTRIFASNDGKILLKYLQKITFFRSFSSSAPESEIRFAEGQRSLVAMLIRLASRNK